MELHPHRLDVLAIVLPRAWRTSNVGNAVPKQLLTEVGPFQNLDELFPGTSAPDGSSVGHSETVSDGKSWQGLEKAANRPNVVFAFALEKGALELSPLENPSFGQPWVEGIMVAAEVDHALGRLDHKVPEDLENSHRRIHLPKQIGHVVVHHVANEDQNSLTADHGLAVVVMLEDQKEILEASMQIADHEDYRGVRDLDQPTWFSPTSPRPVRMGIDDLSHLFEENQIRGIGVHGPSDPGQDAPAIRSSCPFVG
jgi:hypothetical protein